MLQRIWRRKEASEESLQIQTVLEKAAENPILLDHKEREVLINDINRRSEYRFPEFVEFPHPFERTFMYGEIMLNLKHPVTQALLRFTASLKLSKIHKTLPDDRVGNLEDALKRFMERIIYSGFKDKETFDSFHELWLLARETQLFDIEEIDKFMLMPADFIRMPSLPTDRDIRDFHELQDILGEIQPFGMPI